VTVYRIPVVRIAVVREGAVPAKARTIGSPEDAASVLRDLIGDRDRETFAVLMLDTKHRVIAAHIASIGGLNWSLTDPREVFRAAVLAGAKAVVLGHNHPSGDLEPSPADRKVTGTLAKAGDLLGIRVLDHLIVGMDGYVSLAQRGVLDGAKRPR
jgi:DNA repair protein RadC